MHLEIHHDLAAQRFETQAECAHCVLDYRLAGGVMTITHTLVPPPAGGRDVAAELVRTALEFARGEGLKVRPACSYAAIWMERHPDYADLLA